MTDIVNKKAKTLHLDSIPSNTLVTYNGNILVENDIGKECNIECSGFLVVRGDLGDGTHILQAPLKESKSLYIYITPKIPPYNFRVRRLRKRTLKKVIQTIQ